MIPETLGLLTDLYSLTMAFGYWKRGLRDAQSVFHLFFRRSPFEDSFTVACGLETAIAYLSRFKFSYEDIKYLSNLEMFEQGFLEYLKNFSFRGQLDAVAEGSFVFPNTPIIRVKASIIEAQLIEGILLNCINFQSLIASKAIRYYQASQGDPILEFGLRRAQGIDGALSASRAAYVGGCAATSNVLAGKVLGIPVSGTMAHSWVMLHPSEKEAFDAYKSLFPEKCTFLVDTYDTLKGTEIACQIESFNAIRLDSGDLFALAPKCRSILDQHGHTKAKIIASGDLTEEKIKELKAQNIPISTWGVGTALVTGAPSGSLSGVYKLAAIREKNTWRSVMKISNTPAKQSFPGPLALKRFYKNESVLCDVVYQENTPLQSLKCFHTGNSIHLKKYTEATELLLPILKDGHTCYTFPTLSEVRSHALEELARFSTSTPQLAICSALLSEQQSLKDKLRNTNESSYSC
jgi:nicotinate phosphoribosyltransferase